MGFDVTVEVTSTPDTTPPTLVALSVDPTAVDATAGPQTVTATATITDDLSGVSDLHSDFRILFGSPSGSHAAVGFFQHTSGDEFTAQFTIPQFAEGGLWRPSFVILRDQVGNILFLSNSDLQSMGFDVTVEVVVDTIAGLRAIVEGLSLKPNIEGGLLGKLDEAQKALDRGNTRVAENKLQDFIKQVEAQRSKALTNEEATLLVTYASNLILLIE
jgi:hypothetical protein